MRNYICDLYWLIRSRSFEGLSLLHRMCYEYSNLRFAKADRYLRRVYRARGAWRLYTQFAKTQRTPQAPFGETPILTMRRIVRQLGIAPRHCILELGSGTGRLAIWLATQVGCRVIGVEQIRTFVDHAQIAAQESGVGLDTLTFYHGDFMQAPFELADIIYFYGLGLDDSTYERLCLKLKHMKNPPWVISIGGPLKEYCEDFSVMQQFPVVFPWGWTYAYLNVLGGQNLGK